MRICSSYRFISAPEQRNRLHNTREDLTTTSGDIKLKTPQLKGIPFETAIVERYRHRESSTGEALIETYPARISLQRMENITETLWGTRIRYTYYIY